MKFRKGLEDVGFVYLVTAPEAQRAKIGVSQDTNTRIKTLSAQAPVKMLIAHEVEIPNHRAWERVLHNRFSKWRVHGEWFDCSKNQFSEYFDAIDKLDRWACRYLEWDINDPEDLQIIRDLSNDGNWPTVYEDVMRAHIESVLS